MPHPADAPTNAPEVSLEGPRRSPVLSLLTVAGIWEAELGRALRGIGLTTRKYALLGHIGGAPDISFSELARRSQITVQSVHAAVGTLASEGLVADTTAHAGSASALRVTEKGAGVLGEAQRLLSGLDADFSRRAPALTRDLVGQHEEPIGTPAAEELAEDRPSRAR